jgi:hypothetical protein
MKALLLLPAIGALALAAAPEVRARLSSVETDTTIVFREHGVRLTMGALQSGTRKLFARWSIATNELGDATSYAVVWKVSRSDSAGGAVVTYQRVVTTLSDTLRIYEAIAPESTVVNVSVWARRRGLQSVDSVFARRAFRRSDQPPPPPGPVVIDTLVALQVVLTQPTLALGSTAEACAVGTAPDGKRYLLLTTLNPADTLPGVVPSPTLDPRVTACMIALQNMTIEGAIYMLNVSSDPGNFENFSQAWRKANDD